MDESAVEVFLEEIAERFCFDLGGVVDRTERWVRTFLELDVVIELGIEVGKFVSLGFAEDVEVIMVFGGDLRTKGVEFVGGNFADFCSASGGFGIGRFDVKDSGVDFVDLGEHSECGCIHKADLGRTLGCW